MKFLVDAQLPVRLASRLGQLGHDGHHTSSLPDGNRTTDQQIAALADKDGRVVVTKDADFRNSNIGNDDLLDLFESRLAEIERAFALGDRVELRRGAVVAYPHAQS